MKIGMLDANEITFDAYKIRFDDAIGRCAYKGQAAGLPGSETCRVVT
jgi:hypothetical protein